MAMKFGGFTPEQMKVLLPKLGYRGSMQTDEIDMFLAASPRAASQLGRYTETARQMVEGKPISQMRNMANGGFVFPLKNTRGKANRLNVEDNPEYRENIEKQTAAVNKLQNTFPLPQEDTRRFQEGGAVADGSFDGDGFFGDPRRTRQDLNFDPATGTYTPVGAISGPLGMATTVLPQDYVPNLNAEKFGGMEGNPSTGMIDLSTGMLAGQQPTVPQQVIREGDPTIPMSFEEYKMSRPMGTSTAFRLPPDEILRPQYEKYADFVRSGAPEPTARPDPNPFPKRDGTLGTPIDVTLTPSLQQRVESGDMIDGRTLTPAELEQVKISSGTMRGGMGTFYNMRLNGKGIILTTEQRRSLIADDDARRMEFNASQGLLSQSQIANPQLNPAYRPPQAGAQPPTQAVSDPAQEFLNVTQQQYSDALASQQAARDALAADPSNENLLTALTAADSRVAQLNEAVTQAQDQFKQTSMPTPAELIQQSTVDPLSLVTQSYTKTTDAGQGAAGTIDAGSGQAGATRDAITYSGQAVAATGPVATPASTATVTASETGVKEVTSATQASQGQVSADATVQAAQLTPSQLAQLALTPSQIAQAAQVQTPPSRNLAGGELVTGSAVDMATVKAETNFAAATGAPSTDATVQGQLTQLMADFEGGDPPTWAAGAMRAATAAMAQRGLGASSMAGQALIQAAMESALPIAQIDASTFARFEEQSLSNRQQTAMFAAEKRAQFLGVDFTQEFQSRVANASRVADIANVNFNSQQQIALENAQLTQSVDLANLNASNAKVMADAAALSQTDLTNLNNRQQAQVQNAKSFLDMEMANLTSSQQTEMFKSQAVINSLMSDSAAANATAQFNASSENQVTQFFSNLATQISQFNGEQQNSLIKFNVGEANATEQFNSTQVNLRDTFNAQNGLIIDQANAQWYQSIATTDNAAINQSNREAAAQANNMSSLGFSAYMQEVRDLMSFAWQTANNDADRATTLATANLAKEASEANAKANKSAGLWGALGSVAAAILKPIG